MLTIFLREHRRSSMLTQDQTGSGLSNNQAFGSTMKDKSLSDLADKGASLQTRFETRRISMRTARCVTCIAVLILLWGCGKSSKLAPLLPDVPEGWSAEGGVTNRDVSGVGHSSAKTYVPKENTSALGVQRVTVQILVAEKGADQKKLQDMSIENKAQFKEKKELAGFPAYESFPLPSNESHSLDILPKSGTYVQIVAYKGGPGWDKSENRQTTVAVFAGRIDLKRIAGIE
jgi:hypothetical protein